MLHPVFVYVSLKKGFHNQNFLQTATFVGEEKLLDYKMYSLGNFPGIIYAPQTGKNIQGELYLCNTTIIRALDRLEGHPNFYERAFLTLASGRKAWVYIYKLDWESLPLVESGVWVEPNYSRKFGNEQKGIA